MDKLTKEQVNLFSIIASVLMLIAFFFVKMGYATPVGTYLYLPLRFP